MNHSRSPVAARRLCAVLLAALLGAAFAVPLSAQSREATPAEWSAYAHALELLVAGDRTGAVAALQRFVATYPDSPLRAQAERYLAQYEHALDRSGIVPFYLGTLLTTTYASVATPLLFDVSNPILLGSLGLAGVGGGILSSWLLTRDSNMSGGQDLWIEFAEGATITNYQYAFGIVSPYLPDSTVAGKIDLGGQIVASLGARALAYAAVRERDPSAARGSFVLNSYAWANAYAWMFLLMAQSSDPTLNQSVALLVPDAAAVGAYFLWDRLDWSFARTGIVSISGLGGALVGGFLDMILAQLVANLPGSVGTGVIIGSAAAGQLLAVLATSRLSPEPPGRANAASYSFVPDVRANRVGFVLRAQL